MGFTACVDNDYDLSKDIDMTVTIGGENLSIPGSNTDLITMDKILDLDPESDVKADADGNYSLTMDGNGATWAWASSSSRATANSLRSCTPA